MSNIFIPHCNKCGNKGTRFKTGFGIDIRYAYSCMNGCHKLIDDDFVDDIKLAKTIWTERVGYNGKNFKHNSEERKA